MLEYDFDLDDLIAAAAVLSALRCFADSCVSFHLTCSVVYAELLSVVWCCGRWRTWLRWKKKRRLLRWRASTRSWLSRKRTMLGPYAAAAAVEEEVA